jgi:hypothetical protein
MLAPERGKRQADSPRFNKPVESVVRTSIHENTLMDTFSSLGKRIAADAPEGTGPALSKLRATLNQLESSLENLAEAERRKDGFEKTLRHSTVNVACNKGSGGLSMDEIDGLIQRGLEAISSLSSPLPASVDASLQTKQQLRIRELEAQVDNLATQARDATTRLHEERLNRQHQESLLQGLQEK